MSTMSDLDLRVRTDPNDLTPEELEVARKANLLDNLNAELTRIRESKETLLAAEQRATAISKIASCLACDLAASRQALITAVNHTRTTNRKLAAMQLAATAMFVTLGCLAAVTYFNL